MKVLLIGGTGNLSADCAALLHQRGHDIRILTRGHAPVPAGYRAVPGDRRDPAVLASVSADVVINFLGYDLPDVAADYAVFAGKICQYIFISTATVYAKPHRQLPLTEAGPKGNPFSEYARKNGRSSNGWSHTRIFRSRSFAPRIPIPAGGFRTWSRAPAGPLRPG